MPVIQKLIEHTESELNDLKDRLGTGELILETIKASAKRTERLYLIQITFCTYVLLSLAGIKDVDFYTSAEAKLPVIGLAVSLNIFFISAPIIALCLFAYFQLNLRILQNAMLSSNNAIQHGRSSGWLILYYFGEISTKKPSDTVRLIRFGTGLLAWGLPIITAFLCWVRIAPFAWNTPTGLILGGKLPNLPSHYLVGTISLLTVTFVFLGFIWRKLEYAIITKTYKSNLFRRAAAVIAVFFIGIITVHTVIALWPNRFFRLDLSEVNLDGFVLTGANFRGANLYKASLIEANLENAHFEGAILVYANLSGANLINAHLEGAYMRYSQLRNASLVGAHLEGAQLIDAHLEGAYLVNSHLQGANMTSAYLVGAEFSTVNPDDYKNQIAPKGGVKLQGAILRNAHIEGSILNSANLDGADLSEAHLNGAILSFSSMRGANLESVDFRGSTITEIKDGPYDRQEIKSWLKANAKRFSKVKLFNGTLLELITRRLVPKDKNVIEMNANIPQNITCWHEPTDGPSLKQCEDLRREALINLALGNSAETVEQTHALRKAWCVKGVKDHWKNWNGFTEEDFKLVSCMENKK